MSPMGVLKFIGAWGCLIGAIIVIVMTQDIIIPAFLLGTSIAFSQAPTS